MKPSQKLINDFYTNIKQMKSFKYRDYTFNFVKRDIQVKLLKSKKILAIWNVEQDSFESNLTEADVYENKFIKNFKQIIKDCDLFFHKEELNRKQNIIPKSEELIKEIDQYFARLKDDEVSIECINQIKGKLANNWLYEWFDTGGNPDRFADNLYMYEMQTRIWLDLLISETSDLRVKKLLNQNNSTKKLSETEALFIYPKYAQREGNLVTISDLQHQRFVKLCLEALTFATSEISSNLAKYNSINELQVNWWEDERLFYINDIYDKQNPRTFRESILLKMEPVLERRKKPSRIILGISKEEKKINMISPQKGILEWKPSPIS
jgi:hypothetical protein